MGRIFGRRLGLALMLTLTAVLGASPARAIGVGETVSGHVQLGAKQIPLPSGNWTVAGLGTQSFSMPEIGAFGLIQSAILVLPRDNQVAAVLEVNANTLPSSDGWGRTRACAAEDGQLMVINRYRTGWETACQFLRPTRFNLESPGTDAWEQARGFIRKAKLNAPELWLTSGFRISDRHDVIDARFHISPALLLGPAALALTRETDWTGEQAKADPLRKGAVEALAGWSSGFDAWLERGLRNQLREAPGPLPELTAAPASYADVKIAELGRLLREGRIDKAAYDAQVELAKTEVPLHKPSTSVLSNSVRKNISFRSLGTIVDYGIAYLVTANSFISWGIALTLNATDSVWFVLNDQYWDDYYARMDTRDAERMIDFTYLGEKVGAEARL